MKKLYFKTSIFNSFFFLSFLFLLINLNVQSQVVLERVYSTPGKKMYGNNAIPISGGYIIVSSIADTTGFNYYSLIIKTDNLGDTIWTFPVQNFLVTNGVVSSDSVLTLLGKRDSGLYDITVLSQMNLAGNVIRTFDYYPYNTSTDTVSCYSTAICTSTEKGIYITGYRDSASIYTLRYIVKFDSLFNEIWKYENDISFSQSSSSNIIETSTKDVLVYSRLADGGPSNPYGSLLKVDSLGQFKWEHYISVSGHIFESRECSYIISGTLQDPFTGPPPATRGFVAKLDTAGNVLWTRVDTTDSFGAICKGPNNEILVTGTKKDSTVYHAFLQGFDSLGNFLFRRYFRNDLSGGFSSIHLESDSSIIMCGIADSTIHTPVNHRYLYLVKTTIDQSVLAATINLPRVKLKIFPNPVSEILYVETTSSSDINVKIFGINGTEYQSIRLKGNYSIDLNYLPAGIYFIGLTDIKSGESYTTKFIKERE